MKKILLTDYYGTCDKTGNAIGHSPKVLEEYRKLLEGECRIFAAVSPCIGKSISTDDFEKIQFLKYDIVEQGNKKLGERIVDKFKLIQNIRDVLKQKRDYDIIWFYRTDFFMFLYFFLRRKVRGCKIYCLVCHQSFGEGIMGRMLTDIYDKSLKKFDGIIYTQEKKKPKCKNVLYIPDYYYDAEKYGKYRNLKKKDMVVCLGTMSPYKKLEEVVEVFNRLRYPLEIIGYFFEKDRFERLCSSAKQNIVIKNEILSEEIYYQKLAEAKYAILPYDMNQYKNRTSGVLQECIFLKTIPIAPQELLEENGVDGIGYINMEDISEQYLNEQRDVQFSLEQYDMQNIREKVKIFLRL